MLVTGKWEGQVVKDPCGVRSIYRSSVRSVEMLLNQTSLSFGERQRADKGDVPAYLGEGVGSDDDHVEQGRPKQVLSWGKESCAAGAKKITRTLFERRAALRIGLPAPCRSFLPLFQFRFQILFFALAGTAGALFCSRSIGEVVKRC